MAQFSIREAETNFLQLLKLAQSGEEVLVALDGKPVARLVGIQERKSILGIGLGDPNYRSGLSDEETFSPMSAQEAEAFYEGCL